MMIPLLAGMSGAVWAQTALTEPPIPLLPKMVTGLERVGDATPGTDPAEVDAANAAVLKEDGLERFAQAQYTQAAGGGTVAATAMQFVDATAAYSAYTLYRAGMHAPHMMTGASKLGKESVADGDTTLVVAGTCVLKTKGQATGRELTFLTSALPKVSGRRALPALLPTLLPAEGLDGVTARYAVGPVGYKALGGALPTDALGFDKSVEAMTANYVGRVGKGTLTLLLYPTPQIAGEKGRAIEQAMNASEGGHGTLHDALGTVRMRRVGPLVGVTSGGWAAPQAEAVLAALRLDQQVTFDQKMPLEFHSEVKKTATLLQNIAFFCVVVGGGAVLLGLFLGGARAGIRVMQGKPAHSEPEFLTINLREQPKALYGGPVSGTDSGGGV